MCADLAQVFQSVEHGLGQRSALQERLVEWRSLNRTACFF